VFLLLLRIVVNGFYWKGIELHYTHDTAGRPVLDNFRCTCNTVRYNTAHTYGKLPCMHRVPFQEYGYALAVNINIHTQLHERLWYVRYFFGKWVRILTYYVPRDLYVWYCTFPVYKRVVGKVP
jgi:hypothetical protein